jgi:hypothetical protein
MFFGEWMIPPGGPDTNFSEERNQFVFEVAEHMICDRLDQSMLSLGCKGWEIDPVGWDNLGQVQSIMVLWVCRLHTVQNNEGFVVPLNAADQQINISNCPVLQHHDV